jgi:hypothetical protein
MNSNRVTNPCDVTSGRAGFRLDRSIRSVDGPIEGSSPTGGRALRAIDGPILRAIDERVTDGPTLKRTDGPPLRPTKSGLPRSGGTGRMDLHTPLE